MLKFPKRLRDYFAAKGRKGGKVRAKRLSPARRRAIARKAARSRWAKRPVRGPRTRRSRL